MAEDPYRTLGVTNDSTDAEIKRAYRKLARQYHPDRNPNDTASEERFKSIQNAYDLIGSSEARREWDQQRRMENMFGGERDSLDLGQVSISVISFLSSWVEEEARISVLTLDLAEQGLAKAPLEPHSGGQISKRA